MMYCPICDREVESVVRVVSETYPVKGEDITIDTHVRFCVHCGEEMWDEVLDAQNLLDAFAAYRRKHNLLQPAQIRATREKYGLSQTAFARVLGFGDKTITRYENGSIADAAQNNLIYLAQEPRNFKTLLEKNQDRISPADYEAAVSALE
jgi:putative zinc finger/helix-turn-helix YgiT family protein